MRIIPLAFVIVFLGVMNEAYALCVDGNSVSCTIGGKQGTRVCINGRFVPCVIDEVSEPPTSGTVEPKYYILSVIYAPPGTQGGNSSSSVKYGSGSTTGTTVSSSSSFKNSNSVSVSGEVGIVKKIGLEASYEYSRNKSKSQSLDIKKSVSTVIDVPGPSVDGIDHDRDQIWLWLNPKLNLTLTPKVSWTLDNTREAVIQFVYVGHLRDPSKMPPGVAASLKAHGITEQDFPEILKAVPFIRFIIDTKRFKSLGTTFPYEPPFAQGDAATTLTFTITNSTTGSSTSSVEKEHTVGVTVSGEAGFTELFKASVKNENKWSWKNSTSSSTSADAMESAAVTVGGPAFGYNGPTNIKVYYDVLYKTFLFVPIEPGLNPVLQGVVVSRSKKAASGKEVILIANGVKYRTFTNAKGEYRIFDKISGPLQLQVDGVKKRLPRLSLPNVKVKADIVLP